MVLKGHPWLHLPGQPALRRQLHAGDLAFFARNASHVLTESPEVPERFDTVVGSVMAVGAIEEQTALICGTLKLEPYTQRVLLAPLPEVVVMASDADGVPPIVPAVVSSMWTEVRGTVQPLSMTLNRLADVLIAQVLRYVVTQRLATSGIFAALADGHLRRAMLEMIRSPQQEWTVESLARRALMSRSAFAARFQTIVRRTPLEFVREWRMQHAMTLLRAGRSVADVAVASGYQSEASFAKAFKRIVGVGPGAVRSR
ncbi:MAG TPA: AraC family transcriptional regulator [Steroidobacteraceae bacterium]|nr:AraC family transcriptional regulator [Steroidobacteraceae bacterium]